MNYIILFGSESRLVRDIFQSDVDNFIIKIFGRSKPENLDHGIAVDGNSERLYEVLEDVLSHAKRGDNIIFIGAAFRPDNELLVNQRLEDIDSLVSLNIQKYILIVKSLLPSMIRIRSGNLIYLSSFRSQTPTKGAAIYSAAKAFGEVFFRGVAQEYGRLGVRCHSIRMGYFDGRILSSLGSSEAIDKARNRSPLRRLGSSVDLREAVNFCLNSPFSTGGVIDLDGGLDLG